jgi:hypothetical protein
MCRFTGTDDPNYRKVGGEINAIYRMIVARDTCHTEDTEHRRNMHSVEIPMRPIKRPSNNGFSEVEKGILQTLWFPSMRSRLQSLERPIENTCIWLFEHEAYQKWFNGQSRKEHQGLLWLKGKPGVGKSMLMKEAFRQVSWAVYFFFNAKGTELEHSPIGLFRSLVYQLLPRCTEDLKEAFSQWLSADLTQNEMTLKSLFQEVLLHQTTRATFIFIDALDECDSGSIQSQAHFWRRITKWAYAKGIRLNVCLSSRHFPTITVSDCPEIIVENHNSLDITTYVEQKFRLTIAAVEPQWTLLRDAILDKSAGVFLWVVLVVEDVLRKWDDGNGMRFLLNQLDNLPKKLENLFSQMFQDLDDDARQLTTRLFQWVVLAARPCRLHEWHHILAFIRDPAPKSLQDWRSSSHFTQTDDQLLRQLKSISKGLVEVNTVVDESQKTGFETISVCAGAGSLDLEQGETRIVQVMHESVREFFLQRDGFSIIHGSPVTVCEGHVLIMTICLEYIHIKELDALVKARDRTRQKPSPSVVSNGTVSTHPYSNPDPHHTMSMQRSDFLDNDTASLARQRKSVADIPSISMHNSQSDPALYHSIMQWMSTDFINTNPAPPNKSACNSSVQGSFTGRSMLLEDYAALLPYAIFELFTHARSADSHGADPSFMIACFDQRDTWDRWVTLKEDLSRDITLHDYALDLCLYSWVVAIVDQRGYPFEETHMSMKEALLDKGCEMTEEHLKEQEYSTRAPKRSRSVASFSSAGSYSRTGATENWFLT